MKLPEIGDTITIADAYELARYLGLTSIMHDLGRIKDDEVKDWVFDGASCIPDRMFEKVLNLEDTILLFLKHDIAYAYGIEGDEKGKAIADAVMYLDLIKKGLSVSEAMVMLHAVTGSGYLKMPDFNLKSTSTIGLGITEIDDKANGFHWGFAWRNQDD